MTDGALNIRPRFRVFVLAWTVPALIAGFGVLLVPYMAKPDLGLLGGWAVSLAHWMPWAIWSWVVFALCDRVPIERTQWKRAIAVHVPLSLLTSALMIGVLVAVDHALGLIRPDRSLESQFVIHLRSYAEFEVILYWAVVGAHTALRFHAQWSAELVARSQLEADLTEATLSALKSQLNPHFLFNALNSVMTLIGRDREAAQRMLVRLSELLRYTLAASDAQEVPLQREVELVERYLDIERIRFGDRLTVAMSIDPGAREVAVPALVLQPLVENAIIHGLSAKPGPGWVEVSARLDQGVLRLMVRDDGPGPEQGQSRRGSGIGLGNLRTRLQRLYGAAGSVTLEQDPDGGAIATVVIPTS